jgi:hypothetical protein
MSDRSNTGSTDGNNSRATHGRRKSAGGRPVAESSIRGDAHPNALEDKRATAPSTQASDIHAKSPSEIFKQFQHARTLTNNAIDDAMMITALGSVRWNTKTASTQPPPMDAKRASVKRKSKELRVDDVADSHSDSEEEEEAQTPPPSTEQKERKDYIAVFADTVAGITGIPSDQIFPDVMPHSCYDENTTKTASGLPLKILTPIPNAALNDTMAFIKRSGSSSVNTMTTWDLLKDEQLSIQLAKTVAFHIIANNTRFGKHWYRAEQRKDATDRFAAACDFWRSAKPWK